MVELVDQFRGRPATATYEQHAELLRTGHPDQVEHFISSVLAAIPGGGTFLNDSLSYVSTQGLARLADKAVTHLESGAASKACESVIAFASLQRPQLLRPYLERLFALRPNAKTYCENYPWRGAAAADIPFLHGVLDSPRAESWTKAWHCLLQTRKPQALSIAIAAAERAAPGLPIERALQQIGRSPQLAPLYTAACRHIIFPKDYLLAGAPWHYIHPTWRLTGGSERYPFGGCGSARCGLCAGSLHHLITLPSSWVFGETSAASAISLEVCLSCLGWEEPHLSYRYARDGRIEALDRGGVTPEFPAGPLKETWVQLAVTPARWRWQDWGLSNHRENLSRIDGYPCWVQLADFPSCPLCARTMTFLLQLDSDLPTADGRGWPWGSGGIGYCLRCKPCRVTTFHWQCT